LSQVQPASSSRFFEPQVARELGIVAAHLLDEALGFLAADEDLELDAERESGERVASTTA
jgi:hypothetical protein